MKFFELMQAAVALAAAASTLLKELVAALKQLVSTLKQLKSSASYENLSLEAQVDILGKRGRRALVTRKQRVRLLASDAVVVRELIWGEGDRMKNYSVEGARLMGVRQEGSRQVALLSLDRQPARGGSATVVTRRLIQNALNKRDAYAEISVERSTRKLAMTILFPQGRPPHGAHVTSAPPAAGNRRLPVRYGPSGRPYLVWTKSNPDPYTTYSLRWQW